MKNTLLFLLCTVFPFAIFSQSLSGNYTINASLPPGNGNYQSFSTLADDLNNFGVSGPVTVDVAPGIYQDSLYLNYIVGSSSTNTITIDGQDSSQTVLTHDGSFFDATVTLDSADYITIKNMGIINTDSSSGVAVSFMKSNNYNVISGNIIKSALGIRMEPDPDTTSKSGHNIISHNKIKGGKLGGIFLLGEYHRVINIATGNKVFNNEISSMYFRFSNFTGINCQYQDSVEIIGNVIHTDQKGVNIVNSTNTVFRGNRVFAERGNYISNHRTLSPVTRKIEISNNMMVGGLLLTYIDSISIFHNSIFVDSTQVALTINIYDSTVFAGGYDIRNNIFSSKKTHAIETNVSDIIFSKLDNNIYHTESLVLFSIDGYDFADLETYRLNSPQFNVSSLQVDPNFISDTNLHLLTSFAYDKGDNSVGITTDIDGDPRPFPGSANVDIGADEFMPPTLNASILKWNNHPICAGNNQQLLEVANLGVDSIHSFWIIYSINGTKDSIFYTITIPPSESKNVNFGMLTFNAGTIYNVVAYTNLPNGLSDGFPSDDTLAMEIRTGLSGNYTIDSAQATSSINFQSFDDLTTALKQHGVCGATTITVVPNSGLYNGKIFFNGIPGSSSSNTVKINGNGETVRYKQTNEYNERGIINIRNTSYLTIDSLSIEMIDGGFEYAAGIHVLNSSHHITINNCDIYVDSSGTSDGILVGGSSSLRYHDQLFGDSYAINLTNNSIIGEASYGIALIGKPKQLPLNNVISGNTINYSRTGVYTRYQDSLRMENNNIHQLNIIKKFYQRGVHSLSTINSVFNKNIIHDSYVYDHSIVVNNDSTKGNNYVINNLIYNIQGNLYTSGIVGFGMNYFINNTISLTDTTPTYRHTIGIKLNINCTAINNLISIGGGGAGKKIGIFILRLNTPLTSNYNNVFLNSTGTGPEYYAAHFASSGSSLVTYPTLAAWQNTGHGANSMSVDPQFTNPATGDFTPQNPALDGSGTPIPQVTEDLYGDPRIGNPDIGAIEVGNPVGIMEEDGSIFMVFPNPSTGKFTMLATPNKKESFHLSLWDMSGKKLFEKNLSISNSHLEDLDFSEFPKGMYLLKMTTADEEKTEKLIIR